ncbi:MAG: hypothetical protein LC753_00445 [Acidobacteria bacterium]|nr:hypothetical protein [Acidobacteriota bacterium]MCA1648783.1 hypothetical protein [Acidobacteriota bacterium]
MTQGVPRLLLSAFLLVWVPANFAAELLSSLPGLAARGASAIIELVTHAAVAALAAAAGIAVRTDRQSALPLAALAVTAAAVAAVQSLYWSFLPRQTMPGDRLPLAGLNVLHAAAWLVYFRRRARSFR